MDITMNSDTLTAYLEALAGWWAIPSGTTSDAWGFALREFRSTHDTNGFWTVAPLVVCA